MKIWCALPLLIGLLCACTSTPTANLVFVEAKADRYHYDIFFDSDFDFLSFYSQKKYQKPTSINLVCSIDNEPNFAFDVEVRYPIHGSIDFLNIAEIDSRRKYRFKAHVLFRETESKFSGQKILKAAEVDRLLPKEGRMPCKVRILVYLGSAYFSNTFYVPLETIKHLSKEMAKSEE